MELELLVKRAEISLRPVREVNARLAAWYFGYVESDENRRKHHPKVPKLGLLFTVSRISRSKADLYVGSLNDVWVSFPEERWFGGEIPARDIEQRGQLIEAFFGNVTLNHDRCAEQLALLSRERAERMKSARAGGMLISLPDPWMVIFSRLKDELRFLCGLESARGAREKAGADTSKPTSGLPPIKQGRAPAPYQNYVLGVLKDALSVDLRAAGGFADVHLDPLETRIFIAWMVEVGLRGLRNYDKHLKASACVVREMLPLLQEVSPESKDVEGLFRQRFEEYSSMFTIKEGQEPGPALMRTCRLAVEHITKQREPHLAQVMAATTWWWPAVTSYPQILVDLDREGKVAW